MVYVCKGTWTEGWQRGGRTAKRTQVGCHFLSITTGSLWPQMRQKQLSNITQYSLPSSLHCSSYLYFASYCAPVLGNRAKVNMAMSMCSTLVGEVSYANLLSMIPFVLQMSVGL